MSRNSRLRALVATVAATAVLTGCAGSSPGTQPTPAGSQTPTSTATTRPPHQPRRPVDPLPPRPKRTHAVAFHSRTSTVTEADLGDSWHDGCPVGPDGLRAVSLTFWGFDHRAHQGVLISATSAVPAYVAAFRAMYAAHFPIRRLRPVSDYGGSDNRSMAHDNTSAFNCRYAVADGPKHWSMHAYGLAVDIDPRENPYQLDGKVLPPEGRPYVDRADVRPGMIVAGSTPVQAFSAVGWGWGGTWSATPDYQHFSSTGG